MSSLLLRGFRLGTLRPFGAVFRLPSIAKPRPLSISRGFSLFMVNRTSIRASQPQSVTFWKSQMMRFNSTSSKPTATKANDSTVPPIGSRERGLSPEEANLAKGLTWEQFLTLRKAQRRISIGSSVVGCFIAMGLAWVYVAQKEIDPTETIFGLDAFTVYIGGIMCMGVFGYLLGPPLIGDTVFNLTHRNIIKSYATKQKLFLQHIRKMRVDASRQSMNNPVPDYYGEKIGSLRDYRQWLRDNNEYRRKANEFL